MKLTILGICFCLISNQAFAQITADNVTFVPTYVQTADNTTGTLVSTGIDFNIFTSGTTDFSAISVTTPSSDVVNLVQGVSPNQRQWNLSTTLTPVNGTYVFQATGLSSSSQTLDITAAGSFPTTPTLAGTSIENLAAANGTAPVNLSLTYYSNTDNLIALLFDTTTATQVAFVPISSTNFTLAASDFTPGQSYQLEVLASNPTAGGVEYNAFTIVNVGADPAASPEPSTLVLIVFAAGLSIPVLRQAQARSRAAQIA